MSRTCPQCRKPLPPREENRSFPFCSPRCRMVDLGAWLSEDYRVPVGPEETERDGLNEEQTLGLPKDRELPS